MHLCRTINAWPPPLVFVGLLAVGAALQRWVFAVEIPIPIWPRIIAGALVTLCGVSSIAVAPLHFVAVRPEEAYLTDKFGDGYVRYMSTVRRYL